ncbi:hypothetical protein FACS1894218_1270 [Bacilli bacterium]|nr:hypothetical protein FACS1894218_1270 [Bacilli bacterium]
MKCFCWPSAILYLKPKYFYEDKKIQKRYIKGKAVLISNHLTGMDVVLYTLVFVRRYLRCIAGEEAFANRKIRF